jgi:hypothetical protein
MFEHAHIFFSFIVVCTHLRYCITSDVHFIMCALCENNQLKDLVNQKRKDLIFSSMFLCIFFNDKIILICVLII